jgi:hypothetical protein
MQEQATTKKTDKYHPIFNWRNYIKQYIYNEKQKYIMLNIQIESAKKRNDTVLLFKLEKELTFTKQLLVRAKNHVSNIAFNELELEKRKHYLKTIFKKWKNDVCNINDRNGREKINVSNDPYRVIVKLGVDKNGHVSVKMSTPLADIHEKYHMHLIQPPKEVYAKALSEFGYPTWYTDRILSRDSVDGPSMTVQERLAEEKPKKPKKGVSKLNKFKSK